MTIQIVINCSRGPGAQHENVRSIQHDDVIKRKHFSRYWPFVWGIHRSPVNSPHKGQCRGALMLSLICALNTQLSKQSWGWWFEAPSRSLWRHSKWKMYDPYSAQLIKQFFVTWCIVPHETISTSSETSRLQFAIEGIATHPIEVMSPGICVIIKQIVSNIFLDIILPHNHKNCLNKKCVTIHLFYQNLESLMIRECQKSLTNVTVAHLYMQNIGNENKLTNCGLGTAFGDIWLRYWLDVWQQYALTWTIVYELSGRSFEGNLTWNDQDIGPWYEFGNCLCNWSQYQSQDTQTTKLHGNATFIWWSVVNDSYWWFLMPVISVQCQLIKLWRPL